MSRPGGLQLSPVQIVASLLATLTGAILASYLGVGGTLTGAAVGSIASTTGTEVYRHYLRRSQERLKAAGEVLRHRQEPTGQHARHAAGQPAGTAAGRHNGRGPDRPADATETQTLPAAASAWQRRVGGGPAATQSAGERATGQLSGRPATGEPSDGAAPGGGGSGPWWRNLSRRQWLTYGGVALGFFLVAMVIVTIIELSVGKPLDAAVWGKHSTGTSVGNLVGGSGGHKQQPATSHTSTPTTQPSGTTPNTSPSATPSGAAPTPSTSPSSVPSSGSATPTPGGGASGQEISPTP
jgi:hypothetical protein